LLGMGWLIGIETGKRWREGKERGVGNKGTGNNTKKTQT
jgi:hypothetical protein